MYTARLWPVEPRAKVGGEAQGMQGSKSVQNRPSCRPIRSHLMIDGSNLVLLIPAQRSYLGLQFLHLDHYTGVNIYGSFKYILQF